jgi:hypothetical protein
MARFFGVVGYGESVETVPGKWEDVIVEHSYYGDVTRVSRTLDAPQKVNFDVSVRNSIEILADGYANEHFDAIRYVQWMGTRWIVTSVEVRRPRLLLEIGGVYNGPTP